jgi:hypothetical protein
LQVQDVGPAAIQPSDAQEVLGPLQRQSQRRAAEQTGGDGVEEVLAAVPIRHRNVAEPKRRRDELDLRARAPEGRGELVIVRWRVGGRVCDQDAHAT